MGLKINISFKESEKDLYNMVKKQRNASVFVKDTIDFYIKNKDIEVKKEKTKSTNANDLLDF